MGVGRYDCGIQTFDTAPVYSNGLSEVILGKAIKQLNLPREEIVIMTNACIWQDRNVTWLVREREPFKDNKGSVCSEDTASLRPSTQTLQKGSKLEASNRARSRRQVR